jgi:hypothetical protein
VVNDYAHGMTLIASLLLVEPWGRVVRLTRLERAATSALRTRVAYT